MDRHRCHQLVRPTKLFLQRWMRKSKSLRFGSLRAPDRSAGSVVVSTWEWLAAAGPADRIRRAIPLQGLDIEETPEWKAIPERPRAFAGTFNPLPRFGHPVGGNLSAGLCHGEALSNL